MPISRLGSLSAIVPLKKKTVNEMSFKHERISERQWGKTKDLYKELRLARSS